jgi:hypothetical protein
MQIKTFKKKGFHMDTPQNYSKVCTAWLALKIVYGVLLILFGIDKFFFLLSPYNEGIVSPLIRAFLPISTLHFINAVGVFEIILGLMILTNFTYWGALILMAWYLIIDVNLFTLGPAFYLLILNNLAHATGAYALAQLTQHCTKK